MLMKPEQVAEGVALFAEKELLPALKGWRMWAASAALALFYKQSGTLIAGLAGNKLVTALGVVDKDGNIDVDAAADAMKEAVRKHGKLPLDIPVLDIEFSITEKDVETLRGCIKQAAGVTKED